MRAADLHARQPRTSAGSSVLVARHSNCAASVTATNIAEDVIFMVEARDVRLITPRTQIVARASGTGFENPSSLTYYPPYRSPVCQGLVADGLVHIGLRARRAPAAPQFTS